MGTALTGLEIKDTYEGLIKTTDNGAISATAKYLSDGLGNDSALAVSTAAVGIGTTTTSSVGSTKVLEIGTSATGGTVSLGGSSVFRITGTSSSVDMFYAASAPISIYTNSTERVKIDATGNVGIGTSTPDTLVTLGSTARTDNTAGIKIFRGGGTASYATYGFSGNAVINSVGGDLVIQRESSERARFTTAGLCFNGDFATANALDDYEEGTWTPLIFDAASGGNEATYSQNEGVYTKIGNMVYWRISVVLASKGSMTAGETLFVRGFPFTSANISGNWYNPSSVLTFGATFADYLTFHQQGNTTFGYLYEVTSGGNGGALLVSDYTATAAITATGFYRV
jgi:hypothetical protein